MSGLTVCTISFCTRKNFCRLESHEPASYIRLLSIWFFALLLSFRLCVQEYFVYRPLPQCCPLPSVGKSPFLLRILRALYALTPSPGPACMHLLSRLLLCPSFRRELPPFRILHNQQSFLHPHLPLPPFPVPHWLNSAVIAEWEVNSQVTPTIAFGNSN